MSPSTGIPSSLGSVRALFAHLSHDRRSPAKVILDVAIPVVAIAVATGLKHMTGRWFAEDAQVMYFVAVTLSAWRGGPLAGVLAIVLSMLSQIYFFILPRGSFSLARPDDIVPLVAWTFEALVLCTLLSALASTRRRALLVADEALAKQALLTRSEEALRVARNGLEQEVQARTAELQRANADLQREANERAVAQEMLLRSEEAHRLLFETCPVPMYVVDQESSRFLAVNSAALDLYGYEHDDFLTRTAADLRPPTATRKERAGTLDIPDLDGHVRRLRRDGVEVQLELRTQPLTFQGQRAVLEVAKDVTARLRLEGQLRQAQKMEAVGRLAGGVAHDFNNMLSILLGYTVLLLEDLPESDPSHGILCEMKRAAERSADLTRQLLTFSRQQPQAKRVLDLNDTLGDMTGLLHRLLGEDIEIVTHLAPHIEGIEADPGHLEQVIMNLVINARDAMPDGGKLILETSRVEIDETSTLRQQGVAAGSHVMLAISDSGVGMDASTRTKIFEPFFTTKEMGKGTGLGLSIVFGIMQQCGGHVSVYSEVGLGTTFKLYFPMIHAEIDHSPREREVVARLGGTETILLVEDEEQVRRFAEMALRKNGYRVLTAQHPGEAILVCEQHAGTIDLLLTDVIMPHMSGRQLAERLTSSHPAMKVLYMSGYTDNVVLDRGLPTGVAFVQKPLTATLLSRAVRGVLDAHEPVSARAESRDLGPS